MVVAKIELTGRMRGMSGQYALLGAMALVAVVAGISVAEGLWLPALACSLGLLGVLVVADKPQVGVALLLGILCTNDYVSQLLGAGSPGGQLFGILKDALLLLLSVAALNHSKSSRSRDGFATPMMILFACVAASFVLTGNIAQALYGFRSSFEPLILLLVIPAVLSPKQAERLVTIFILASQACAMFALVTYSRGLEWLAQLGIFSLEKGSPPPSSYFVNGSMKPRAFSPFAGPNQLGLAMGLAIAAIACRPNWSVRRRLLLMALPGAALCASRSRSAMLGVAILALVFLGRHLADRREQMARAFVVVAVSGVALIVVVMGMTKASGDTSWYGDASAKGHYSSFASSVADIARHPLGHGVGTVGPTAARYTDDPILVESFTLLVALEAGWIALIAYVVILRRLWGRGAGSHGQLGFLAAAAVVVMLVSQAVLPSLQGTVGWLVWLVAACGVACLPSSSETDRALAAKSGTQRPGVPTAT